MFDRPRPRSAMLVVSVHRLDAGSEKRHSTALGDERISGLIAPYGPFIGALRSTAILNPQFQKICTFHLEHTKCTIILIQRQLKSGCLLSGYGRLLGFGS